ncbi:MAG: hypothetical protein ACODAA_00530 [Gemmatimonadota bacterium]
MFTRYHPAFLPLLPFLVLAGCSGQEAAPAPPTWQLVYQHDEDGNPLAGKAEDLVDAMKRGSPIRVSWGGTVEDDTTWIHFAEPDFTAVMGDTAVVAQFPPSLIQTNYVDARKAFLQTDPPTEWRALMATTGNYHQFHRDLETGEVTRIMHARTQMSWFALIPGDDDRPIADLVPEDAFVLDSVVTP